MRRARSNSIRMLAVLFVLSMLPGCVFVGPRSIVRTWANWNTYGQCAFAFDRLDHMPLRQPRVESIRWAYGLGPVPPPVGPGACDTGPLAEAAAVPPAGVLPPPAALPPSSPLQVPPAASPPPLSDPPLPPAPGLSTAVPSQPVAAANHPRSVDAVPGPPGVQSTGASVAAKPPVDKPDAAKPDAKASLPEGAWLFRRR